MNARDSAKLEEEFRQHPLTFVLTLVFACVCALGLIYIFAFSDTSEQRWQHFFIVFALAAFVGSCLAFAKKKEDRGPFPLIVRRWVWGSVLICYAFAAVFVLKLGASPFARFTDTLRLLCYLGNGAPFVYVAWRLFRANKKG
jgi:hypothetical protein